MSKGHRDNQDPKRWESFVQVEECPTNWVERDYPSGYLRYTLYPSGETLLQHPFYQLENKLAKWRRCRDAFFEKLPADLPILTPQYKYVGVPRDVIGFDGYER